jgi:hypothetical protein
MLLGDDLTNATRQARAQQFCTNRAVNAVSKTGKPFRPVEGNTGDQPAESFVLFDSGYVYIALFNFTNAQAVKSVQLSRAGITDPSVVFDDLWLGTQVTATSALSVSLGAYDSRLYKSVKQFASVPLHRTGLLPGNPSSVGNPSVYDALGKNVTGSLSRGNKAALPAASGYYVGPDKKKVLRVSGQKP